MCGLYGFRSTEVNRVNIHIAKGLGLLMQERGFDSTGVAYKKNGQWVLSKDITAAEEFFVAHPLEDTDFLIGHTRAATTGAITIDNAHPFIYGDVVGAHNGVVPNWKALGADPKLEVDSQAIISMLQTRKPHKLFKRLNGSYALTWSKGNDLYLFRHHNPLTIARTATAIYWSSLYDSMIAVLAAAGIDATVETVLEDRLYKIDKDLNVVEYQYVLTAPVAPKAPVYCPTYNEPVKQLSRGIKPLWGTPDDYEAVKKTIGYDYGYDEDEKTILYEDDDFMICKGCGNKINRYKFNHGWDENNDPYHLDCLAQKYKRNKRADAYVYGKKESGLPKDSDLR